MSTNFNFSGKRILITGGGNGLGRALVKKFHEENVLVFTVDKDENALKTLKTEYPNVTYAVVDLNDWDATRKVIESFGRMDYLVNNAGVQYPEPFLNVTKESLEKQLNVNYAAMVNVSQVVARGMIESKIEGSIVNISSVGDKMVFKGLAIYCATKAAVTMLTKSMAVELGVHNIRVNCVSPGYINTNMAAKSAAVISSSAAILEQAIIKRPIEPSEIADLVWFLLSPLAGMITGSDVVIDGGITIN